MCVLILFDIGQLSFASEHMRWEEKLVKHNRNRWG
ncbi:hypothetical protein DI53_0830 [Sphingobacterium deserti]|uniref:Uncharacterized protein n=1 Tax=Sphingobacterium deserti TaxID=1229276 RepID=A0A0B8T2E9_9SPHI|nr:hypothetical protein DI53_0830 [Sphingobacterium deserti]